MTRHLEDGERAMQERVQRLEAVASPSGGKLGGSGGWVWLEGVPGQGRGPGCSGYSLWCRS